MTVASVMVYVDPAQQAEEQVRVARMIATKFKASLTGVSAFAIEPHFAADGVLIPDTTPEDVRRLKTELAAKEEWFREVAGLPTERVQWRCEIEYPLAFLADQARAADLVVLKNTHRKADPYQLVDPAEAVLRMGRPTVLVPEHVHELQAERVVIGWKDTREARLAVHDALPFLKRAAEVTVIEHCVADDQERARRRVRDVAGHLRQHGVKPESDVRVYTAESDAHQLIRMAKDHRADLIVSGAYGHSRLGEWVFGGMTRGLMDEAPFCLMMSH
jgi:nucleotide-binding universal stress UspA family protein